MKLHNQILESEAQMTSRLAIIPKSVIARLPESIARENGIIPVAESAKVLTVAATFEGNESDVRSLCRLADLQAKLELICGCAVKLEPHTSEEIYFAIDRHYDRKTSEPGRNEFSC